MSVTPDFIGQIYKDTNTGNLWRANSLTPGDWTLELQNFGLKWLPHSSPLNQALYCDTDSSVTSISVQAISCCNGLQLYNLDNLASLSSSILLHCGPGGYAPLYIDNCPLLQSVDLATLIDIQDELSIFTFNNLTTIDLRSLQSIGGTALFQRLPVLTSLRLDALQSVADNLEIADCNILTSVSIPNLNDAQADVGIATCPLLTTIDLSSWLPASGAGHTFSGNALTAASVNALLARGVANASFVSGTFAIAGGTNAAPTGQGLVDKATLIARGVNVLTN